METTSSHERNGLYPDTQLFPGTTTIDDPQFLPHQPDAAHFNLFSERASFSNGSFAVFRVATSIRDKDKQT
jgi:hypothetical protein